MATGVPQRLEALSRAGERAGVEDGEDQRDGGPGLDRSEAGLRALVGDDPVGVLETESVGDPLSFALDRPGAVPEVEYRECGEKRRRPDEQNEKDQMSGEHEREMSSTPVNGCGR